MPDYVYIGRKPVMAYVMACITCLNFDNDVIIAARGRLISTAVDVTEALKTFISFYTHIEIGTEKIQGSEGEIRNISTIKIRVAKQG